MASYPALDLRFVPGPGAGALQDLLYAELDSFEPIAIEDHETAWRVFFRTSIQRDAALLVLSSGLGGHVLDLAAVDVDDGDWARRSQADLKSIRVGRIVVAPPWDLPPAGSTPVPGSADDIVITITPSMGFGTGHHASTRLCLALLQDTEVRGRRVIDIGTGSGVLAIAAARLGAASVTAIDNDPDAIESARENVESNGMTGRIHLAVADLRHVEATADILLGNLTATVLTAQAVALQRLIAPGGLAILSGFTPADHAAVRGAWPARALLARLTDDGWEGCLLQDDPGAIAGASSHRN